ncbi:MAG TPA: hypothetical protein VFF13_03355 [archaeon]|nr:hypothetical protein [archaeon]
MKHSLLFASIILLSYITVAGTVEEFSFKSQGYQDFYIEGFDSYDCKQYDFVFNSDINATVFPIFSLDFEFLPKPGKDAKITVFLNDGNAIAELKPGIEKQTGKTRIWLPKEKLKSQNNIKVCGQTAFTANQVRIVADSTLGIYTTPYFPKENGFVLELEKHSLIVGEPFRMEAIARNYGSEDAQVELTYRRGELEENTPEITILSGKTTNNGVVPKCERRDDLGECIKPGEYKIVYTASANRAVPFSLLPAIMTFENIFGETSKIETNRPEVEAFEHAHILSAQIFLDNDSPFAGDVIPIVLNVKNIGNVPVSNVVVKLDTGLEVIGGESKTIGVVEPGKTEKVEFSAKGLIEGEYTLGCSVSYNQKTLECSEGTVSLEAPSLLSNELLFGLAFVLIAIAVFSYFYFKK